MSQLSTINHPAHEATETPKDERLDSASPLDSHYAKVIGAFKDDPMLDAMMARIRERRQEIDEDETIV